MSKVHISAIAAVLAFTALPGRTWAVTNAVVGTCKAGTQFTTIQAAVNAATAGSTVSVCPGTYAEQVTILKNLTLVGIDPTSVGSAIIYPPPAGLHANTMSGIWGPLGAQILVQQAATVTTKNIKIDGGGQTTCTGNFTRVGILFQGPGGVVTDTAIRNAPTCRSGIALFADAVPAAIKLTNNILSDCGRICLEADFDDNLVASGNQITAVVPMNAGIEVQSAGGPNALTGNVVAGNITVDAVVYNSFGMTMTGNIFLAGNPAAVGIYLDTVSNSTVQNDKIWGDIGLYLE